MDTLRKPHSRVTPWVGFVIETPMEKKRIYGRKLAIQTFNLMVKLWRRQAGQIATDLPAAQFNQDNVWPRQLANVLLTYTREGKPHTYGHMILWEHRYANRINATSGKRSSRRVT